MFSCCLTDNPISVFVLLHNTFRSRDLILGPLTDHVAHILPHFEYYTARDFIFRAKFKFFSFFSRNLRYLKIATLTSSANSLIRIMRVGVLKVLYHVICQIKGQNIPCILPRYKKL